MNEQIRYGAYRYSYPTVKPANWDKIKQIKEDWYIQYYFYTPDGKTHYKVVKGGINRFKTIKERQEYTKELLENIVTLLKSGYNPLTRTIIEEEESSEITTNTHFIDAFFLAHKTINGTEKHKKEILYIIRRIEKVATGIDYMYLPIGSLKRSHIKDLLERMELSDDMYNRVRNYLSVLISELLEYDVIEYNFIRDIKKKKTVSKIREVLSDKDFVLAKNHLADHYPDFYRYMMIFFSSGSRSSELLNMKVSDVDLKNMEYRILVKKGNKYFETTKVIIKSALPYWQKQLNGARADDYVFSRGLIPGVDAIQPYQITKRWYRLVKKPLGITADFYSLKHKFLDLLDEAYQGTDNIAKWHAAHTSDAMTNKVYLQTKKKRANEALKNLDI